MNFDASKAFELRNRMINTIMHDKASISILLISGAVDRLRNHLVNFIPTPDDQPEFSRNLHECISRLSDPDNNTNQVAYEVKNVGIHATQTFHQQIAKFIMQNFQDTLESEESQPHEIRMAIRGFGAMAAVCKRLCEPKHFSERFDLVMQRTEFSYYTNDRLKRREVLPNTCCTTSNRSPRLRTSWTRFPVPKLKRLRRSL